MDLNDSNFKLQTTVNKFEVEARALADSKILELQSELKFKVKSKCSDSVMICITNECHY